MRVKTTGLVRANAGIKHSLGMRAGTMIKHRNQVRAREAIKHKIRLRATVFVKHRFHLRNTQQGGTMNKEATKLDELKKKYDALKIDEIETKATRELKTGLKHRKEFISALYYLERTGRYQENKRYKSATFWSYIYDTYAMRKNTYQKERLAFIGNPDATEKYGVGVVTKAREKCGPIKMNQVFKELDAKPMASITPKVIESVIDHHKKPEKVNPAVATRAPNHVTVAELQEQLAKKDKIIFEQTQLIKAQAEQIDRLKTALRNAKNIIDPAFIPVKEPCSLHA